MNNFRILFPLFVIVLLTIHPVPQTSAWGRDVHSQIAKKAIDLLPEPYRSELRKYRIEIEDASIAPDDRKGFDIGEGPRHYDDQDDPHIDYNVSKTSNDYKLGVVAWAAENASRDLTAAMEVNDVDLIIRYLGDVAHYISDATQPFHATKNYNGQYTGNEGIHARFETEVVHKNNGDVFNLTDFGSLFVVDDVYNLTEKQVQSGLDLVPDILAADDTASASSSSYDSTYYDQFYELVRDILRSRIQLAIYHTACVWYTAIVRSNWLNANQSSLAGTGENSNAAFTPISLWPFVMSFTTIMGLKMKKMKKTKINLNTN